MKVYTLEKKTQVSASIHEAWDYFSSPSNLNELTPPDVRFRVLSNVEGTKMFPGMIINYKIRPLSFITFRWTTEITHCSEYKFFVDEQRFGPYSFWHHLHKFEETADGVLMTDTVHYGLKLGLLGRLVLGLYVKKKLSEIFIYREKKVKEIFSGK